VPTSRPDQGVRGVLFLCTGNYFRSRLAERVFNHRATEGGLPWRATSRGLAPQPELRNLGPVSPHCLRALAALGLPAGADRFPLEASRMDLEQADLIVAVNNREHRPLLEQRFPALADGVEYWSCEDVDRREPDEASQAVIEEVEALVRRLEREAGSAR
jgi:protein-tyrosine phosphatase